MKKITFIVLVFLSGYVGAQTDSLFSKSHQQTLFSDAGYELYKVDTTTYYAFQKPGAFEHFPNSFVDVYDYSIITFSKDNLPTLGWIAASTALLLVYDQAIIDESQRFGRRIGLKGTNQVKTVQRVLGFPIQMPTDFASGLYFIGDGWTHTMITASFFTYGLIADDSRALRTTSQLAEGILAVTYVTQFLKHITGRQSPFKSTEPGGRWDFFPNQKKYHQNVPAYDAYPSGHLAAGLVTLLVIAENYKEYKFIKPLGYSLLTILAYQMLNNGVHWASDYPLSIVMGFTMAELVLKRGRKSFQKDDIEPGFLNKIDLGFGVGKSNQIGLSLSYKFN